MSHYADLEFAGYPVLQMRNYVAPAIMTLFADSEKVIRSDLLDGEVVEVVEYRSSVDKFIQRLEIMGYTLAGPVLGLEAQMQELLQDINLTESEKELISAFNFKTWKTCMGLIVRYGLSQWNVEERLPDLEPAEDQWARLDGDGPVTSGDIRRLSWTVRNWHVNMDLFNCNGRQRIASTSRNGVAPRRRAAYQSRCSTAAEDATKKKTKIGTGS